MCSMWRLLCIAFYGAFACGAASEAYGPRITSAAQTASKQFKVPSTLTAERSPWIKHCPGLSTGTQENLPEEPGSASNVLNSTVTAQP